ncbi:multiple inositol polyphosphate phosphatase 1-like isoform X2 [Hermetia illucens]|uniref:multiple inositol polyphosphate phosphatase 1-like isoform X2 n=1 Tax=Hermetia illucens TaxID=343691 RepID=UPI0018CC5DE4|nr:multiple inositol polyphosphate phosphatase 1-like isoform X2 [Hermetia illucens]
MHLRRDNECYCVNDLDGHSGEMNINFWLAVFIVVINYQNVFGKKHFGAACCEEYCYSTDKVQEHMKHRSSSTAYQLVKGIDYFDQSGIPNCKPVRFWFLSRHGTRLPGKEEIEGIPGLVSLRDNIIENYEVKKTAPAKGALCGQDLELLKNWVVNENITMDKNQYLTDQGWNDLKGIAEDYKEAYPTLLGREYEPSEYAFHHSGNQRTEASMMAFIEGLFGPGASENISQPAQYANDTFLLPAKYCPAWSTGLSKINEPGSETSNFIASSRVAQMLTDIGKRLGFDEPLTFKQVQLIYNMCAYEKAWYLDKPSPWCSVLTLDQVKIVEYQYDLFYQYRSGYGNDLNYDMPCKVMKDMLNRMAKDEGPRVTAYFSHSSLLQMFAIGLGVFKDSSLMTNSNYDSMEGRKWRSSKIDPFASNYAIVKYDCSKDENDPSPTVKFFLNQRSLEMDNCTNGLCRLEDVLKTYKRYLDEDCEECQDASEDVAIGL